MRKQKDNDIKKHADFTELVKEGAEIEPCFAWHQNHCRDTGDN